jgi:Fungal Zn(2)-Cys(6) binuclear cluster domain
MLGSRRSKTKCTGDRPQCRSCSKRNLACSWAQIAGPNTFYALTPPQEQDSLRINEREPRFRGHSAVPDINSLARTPHVFPQPLQLQRLFDLFFIRHHEVEFCSFFHRPSLDIPTLHDRSPLLAASVLSLGALYLSTDEAVTDFGFATPYALSDYYARLAKFQAYDLFDEPSSK